MTPLSRGGVEHRKRIIERTWIHLTVKSFTKESEAFPIKVEAMIIWPVEETGKNSVSPSIMAKIMASKKLIEKNKKNYSSDFTFLLGFIIAYKMKT